MLDSSRGQERENESRTAQEIYWEHRVDRFRSVPINAVAWIRGAGFEKWKDAGRPAERGKD